MMQRIGFAVHDLGANELNWRLFRQANAEPVIDTTFFFEEIMSSCVPLNVASMHILEAWGYSAPIIATNLNSARRIVHFPGTRKKLLYAWDLEWLRMHPRPFRAIRSVYSDKRLLVVARTEEHKRMLETLWGANVVAVLPTPNLQLLAEIALDTAI